MSTTVYTYENAKQSSPEAVLQPFPHVHNKLTDDTQEKDDNTHIKVRIPATTLQQYDNSKKFTTGLRSMYYNKATTDSQQGDLYENIQDRPINP